MYWWIMTIYFGAFLQFLRIFLETLRFEDNFYFINLQKITLKKHCYENWKFHVSLFCVIYILFMCSLSVNILFKVQFYLFMYMKWMNR